MRHRATSLLATATMLAVASCGDSTEPSDLAGTYDLIAENGDPVPSDPSAPDGCCITLSGTLALTATTYDLHLFYRNRNNAIEFDNSEQGTWALDGDAITFTRTGGGGEGVPYLLAPGTVTGSGDTITLHYGDEGPGSDQIEGIFARRGN
jgi:hypothetical protein